MLYAIILASGKGTRFCGKHPKQFAKIAGKTVIERAIEVFEKSTHIDKIIVVITPEHRQAFQSILNRARYTKIDRIVDGGETRKESASLALSHLVSNDDYVFIHDAARPFLSETIIDNCVKALKHADAVGVAIPSTDTLYEIDAQGKIIAIPDRRFMKRAQTPQCFKVSVIKKAHVLSADDDTATDDCTLVVKHNLCPVFLVDGDNRNIKITVPEDIFRAREICKANDEDARDKKRD